MSKNIIKTIYKSDNGNRRNITKTYIILIAVLILGLNKLSVYFKGLIEKNYSTSINKYVVEILSFISGLFKFSLAEVILIVVASMLVMYIVLFIYKIINLKNQRKNQAKQVIFNFILNILCSASIIYTLFVILWGFNYNREAFSVSANITVTKSSTKELRKINEILIEKANDLRKSVNENSKGIMVMGKDNAEIFKDLKNEYEKISSKYPVLSGRYSTVKPVYLSNLMSYTGITGFYFPFTGEANVNTNITELMIPCTAAHEMAHARGFAREDEANFIAFLVTINSSNINYQYGGTMLALIYSMNELYENDIESYKILRKKYSEGVLRDLTYESEFWFKYEGKIQEVSDKVNNTYLKSNGQNDGVKSYGRMVDLLIGYYKIQKSTID